ncbi:MAG TPA: hypothetical protein VMY37_35425 [Thermoguttaceae bacterium]|nr:hypothetical protein [Thermoguttaceae bacterium]
MYRSRLKPPTVDTCKFRRDVRREDGVEVGTCTLLKTLMDCHDDRWCRVRRDACDACCQSFPPSRRSVNPAVASLLCDATAKIVAARPAGYDLERIEDLGRAAVERLSLVCSEHEAHLVPTKAGSSRLSQLVPPPARRRGRIVHNWAVGVTTAPRGQPTLEACLESLVRAGWDRPHLFVDSAVRVPDRFSHLPGTFRDEKIGAWPNYYLALMELLMREPYADAYMIVQDDAVLFDRESVREYLKEVLWPGRSSVLVSLYCSQLDSLPDPGWHSREGGWISGAHAFVFPPQLAKAFVMDRPVFDHRWTPGPSRASCLDDLIGEWATGRGVDVWFPTPSLAQHVGDASTLWPAARAIEGRRAEPFAGDLP